MSQLLVPIHVSRCLVLPGRDGSPVTGPASLSQPPLDGDLVALERGMHLYWALPDGLARSVPGRDALGRDYLEFPTVPDRWVVVRLGPPVDGRRPCRAWIVDSVRRVSRDLSTPEPRDGRSLLLRSDTGGEPRRLRLTVAGLLPDARWYRAARPEIAEEENAPAEAPKLMGALATPGYYPEVRDRWGFHDPLDDHDDRAALAGPFTYLVVGWYSVLGEDPLYKPTTSSDGSGRVLALTAARRAFVASRGWAVASGQAGELGELPAGLDRIVCHGASACLPPHLQEEFGASVRPPSAADVAVTLSPTVGEALGRTLFGDDPDYALFTQILQRGLLPQLQHPDALFEIPYELHRGTFYARVDTQPEPWWNAAAPLLVLQGTRRGFSHGNDGRYDEGGRLRCRRSDDVIGAIEGMDLIDAGDVTCTSLAVPAAQLLGPGPSLGGLGPESVVARLLAELCLLDPGNAPFVGAAGATDPGTIASTGDAMIQWLVEQIPGEHANHGYDIDHDGLLPSPVAVQLWMGQWEPVFVEVESSFASTSDVRADWALGPVEHSPVEGAAPGRRSGSHMGRYLLSAVAPDVLAGAIQARLLGAASDLDLSQGTEELESKLARYAENAAELDLLACRVTDWRGSTADELFAGTLEISRIKVVDSFGQAVLFQAGESRSRLSRRAESAAWHRLPVPPRLRSPGRLVARWAPADGSAGDASTTTSMVVGYLAPDYVEKAVEVFDAAGTPLGQLRHRGGAVVWERPPGAPDASWPDYPKDPLLAQVVRGLGPGDPGGATEDLPKDETSLVALMRLIDTVQLTSQPPDHQGLLMGQPLAIVRLRLRLELGKGAGDPGPIQLRLGDLYQSDDGLVGWLLDGEPCIHPPARWVKECAAPDVRTWDLDRSNEDRPCPITHAYVSTEDTLTLLCGQDLHLTLLMVPHSAVHLVTGVLPRVRIELPKLLRQGSEPPGPVSFAAASSAVPNAVLTGSRPTQAAMGAARVLAVDPETRVRTSFRVGPVRVVGGRPELAVPPEDDQIRWRWIGAGKTQPVAATPASTAVCTERLVFEDGYLIPAPTSPR